MFMQPSLVQRCVHSHITCIVVSIMHVVNLHLSRVVSIHTWLCFVLCLHNFMLGW
jgi:hypothetical protein